MNRKISLLTAGLAFLGILSVLTLSAHAQLFPYTTTSSQPVLYAGSTTTASSTVTTTTASSSNSKAASGTMMTASTTPSSSTGVVLGASTTLTMPLTGRYVQFNGLTIASISSQISPAEITVNNAMGTCMAFTSAGSSMATPIACPSSLPTRIEVSASTKVLLKNRATGVVANITPGDQINVFGYYAPDGTLQASIVRDLSKPIAFGPGPVVINFSTSTVNNGTSTVPDVTLGTITQVNPDGSFVAQLFNGQTITVPSSASFIHVGATLTLQNALTMLNRILAILNLASSTR